MTKKKPSFGLFREIAPNPQTPFEKTAAAAKSITETESTKRADLTATLRAARLAKAAGTPVVSDAHDPSDATSKASG